MKMFFAILAIAAALMPFHASAQDRPLNQGWSYSVGAGILASPCYLGDDEYRILALPIFTANYADKFFVSLMDGVGYNFLKNDHWRVGLVSKYVFSRDEDGDSLFRIAGKKTNDLRGLGDVDGTVELGGFAEFTLNPITAKVEVRQGVGGHEGLVGEAKVEYKGQANIFKKPVNYSIGPEIKYADSSYHEAYFSVNASQSAASGLSLYSTDAGVLSYGISGSIIVMLTDRISSIFFAGYSKLGDEAANSSLVTQRGSENQGIIGLFINYNF